MCAGRAIEEGGKWSSQPIRSAVSNVAGMSEALWVPDLGLERQSTCSHVGILIHQLVRKKINLNVDNQQCKLLYTTFTLSISMNTNNSFIFCNSKQ